MFFWILIKLNFIPILICWKKILYLENSSTQNQQLNFQMRPFATHIYYFSQWQLPLQQSLKPPNIAHITSSIIHMTQQLNIQLPALKNVKLSYLIGSVDKNNVYFHMTCLLPKYWKLLSMNHTFIDHAVKHKKTIN